MQRPPIAQVLERHTDEILALPSVVGIGEGAEGNDAVIVVFVTRLTPEVAARLPREIEGYRVVPRESGEVRAQPR